MSTQIPLIPVSPRECTEAAYRLDRLLQDEEDDDEAWAEAQKERKDTKAVRKRAIATERAIIRRAREEAEDAAMSRPGMAYMPQAEEVPR